MRLGVNDGLQNAHYEGGTKITNVVSLGTLGHVANDKALVS